MWTALLCDVNTPFCWYQQVLWYQHSTIVLQLPISPRSIFSPFSAFLARGRNRKFTPTTWTTLQKFKYFKSERENYIPVAWAPLTFLFTLQRGTRDGRFLYSGIFVTFGSFMSFYLALKMVLMKQIQKPIWTPRKGRFVVYSRADHFWQFTSISCWNLTT